MNDKKEIEMMMILQNDLNEISNRLSSEKETLPTLEQKIKELDLLIQTSCIYQEQPNIFDWEFPQRRWWAQEMLKELHKETQSKELLQFMKDYQDYVEKLTDAQKDLELRWTSLEKEIHKLGGVNLGTVYKANEPLVNSFEAIFLGPLQLAIRGVLGFVVDLIGLAITILCIPFDKPEDLRLEFAITEITMSMKMIGSAIITPFYRIATMLNSTPVPDSKVPDFKEQIKKIAMSNQDAEPDGVNVAPGNGNK